VWLAKRGHAVTAVDLSSVAIERAHQLAEAAGVTIDAFVVDLNAWQPEPETYDLVLMAYLHLQPQLRRRVHAMARATLAPGGVVFVVAHHLDNLDRGTGGPQIDELLITEDELAEDFAGLEIDRLETLLRPVEDADRPAIDVVLKATKPEA
jgi:SAM-dependent methyltransferase